MNLVSWTLAGAGTAPIIDDAIRSASRIAHHRLVIFTSPTRCELPSVGNLSDRDWAWTGSFADARNAALRLAEETGASWSTMIDDDERVVCPDPAALRAYLATLDPTVAVVLAHSEEGTHTRERFFRHPNPGKFHGRSHEQFRARPGGTHEIVPREIVYWTELPKTPEQLAAKGERDVTMLRADVADEPTNGAAWYYLGATLQNMGRHREAIEAWRECIQHDMREGGAWASFKAGESYLEIGEPDRAIDCALAGMARDAGIAELPWLAALASLRIGRWDQARRWAFLAQVHAAGSEAEKARTGFRIPRGLTAGPAEVLAFLAEHEVKS